ATARSADGHTRCSPRVIRWGVLMLVAVMAAVAGRRRGTTSTASPMPRAGSESAGSADPLVAAGIALQGSPPKGLCTGAWPDGRIEVSRALVDRLDEEELAAALAHELGHLLEGGHLPVGTAGLDDGPPLGLRGAAGADEAEARADRIGCALLARRGIRCEA